MIGFTRSVWVFAYGEDRGHMSKGFDGLYGLVKDRLERDQLSGDTYWFVSGNRKRAKILVLNGTGQCEAARRAIALPGATTLAEDLN